MTDSVNIMPSCSTCRYSITIDEVSGTCHRHAPHPLLASTPSAPSLWWPVITSADYCGDWAPFLTYDELFADYLARNTEAASAFAGIPVLPMPASEHEDESDPACLVDILTYDEPFEDPLQ